MQKALIFPPKMVDLQNYYYFKEGFSKEELNKIYNDVAFIPFQKAGTGESNENEDTSVRSSQIKWVHATQEWSWLYDKLMAMITEANNSLWKFNLYGALDAIQYTEYHASENGHYGWHQDIGPGVLSTRKISLTVQLSDPTEYEGGYLEYFKGGDPNTNAIKVDRHQGLVFIFPSFMLHRVTPITKGVRRSFVLWVGGEHYM